MGLACLLTLNDDDDGCHNKYKLLFHSLVVLAPYGIMADLIGPAQSEKNEEELAEEFETWSNFYPIRSQGEQIVDTTETKQPFCVRTSQAGSDVRNTGTQRYSKSAADKRPTVAENSNESTQLRPIFVEVLIGKLKLPKVTAHSRLS